MVATDHALLAVKVVVGERTLSARPTSLVQGPRRRGAATLFQSLHSNKIKNPMKG